MLFRMLLYVYLPRKLSVQYGHNWNVNVKFFLSFDAIHILMFYNLASVGLCVDVCEYIGKGSLLLLSFACFSLLLYFYQFLVDGRSSLESSRNVKGFLLLFFALTLLRLRLFFNFLVFSLCQSKLEWKRRKKKSTHL